MKRFFILRDALQWLGLRPGFPFWQGVLMVVAGSLICWLATRRYG